MNGRKYRLISGAVGTHALSCCTSADNAATNNSSGNSGIASRAADLWNR
jgi:hypothetical protein